MGEWTWVAHAKWMDNAACVGEPSDIFFEEENVAKAREICARCPVFERCKTWAFEQREFGDETGVYAGLLPRQRRSLARTVSRGREIHRTTLNY